MSILVLVFFLFLSGIGRAATVLVEAESFADRGGWMVDQQAMDEMGSPYLLAHGLGEPVQDAVTKVTIPRTGVYRVFVRTKDWVACWNAPGKPGQFKVRINDTQLHPTFGTEGAEWFWHDGGTVTLDKGLNTLCLHDLTGFEGRCDAVLFTDRRQWAPPNRDPGMQEFREELLGFSRRPSDAGTFDLVVTGGGIAGICAAVSAARLDLKVALIQDRPVLGGNNSSEVRVWLNGARNVEPYPRVGDIVAELEQKKRAHYGPDNTAELYEDARKESIVRSEKNIALFLRHRGNGVELEAGRIQAVIAQHTISGKRLRFKGRFFADCTGDGCIGFLAGADYEATAEGHMGRCNLWNVMDTGKPSPFPPCPWALDLHDKPFPGRAKSFPGTPGDARGVRALGVWYWESGFDHDPILKGEYIRDWNFRAMYGAWDALKNTDKIYPDHKLNWAAYVAGKRESRRLLGDVVLTQEDILDGKEYPDGCVATGWLIDLHLPDKRYVKGFEGDGFISKAHYTKYKPPYWVPYRCLYSRNVDNLFVAGRDISVTHRALGTVRVMRTCGLMGEIVGMAASLCKKHKTDPRGVYTNHLAELKVLMKKGVGKPAAPFPALKNSGTNRAKEAEVTTAGDRDSTVHPPHHINDGKVDLRRNSLRWLSSSKVPHWIEFAWTEPKKISAARIVSGYNAGGKVSDPVTSFVLQYYDGNTWNTIGSTDTTENKEIVWSRRFPPVTTERIRLLVRKTTLDISRIWEVELYEK